MTAIGLRFSIKPINSGNSPSNPVLFIDGFSSLWHRKPCSFTMRQIHSVSSTKKQDIPSARNASAIDRQRIKWPMPICEFADTQNKIVLFKRLTSPTLFKSHFIYFFLKINSSVFFTPIIGVVTEQRCGFSPSNICIHQIRSWKPIK